MFQAEYGLLCQFQKVNTGCSYFLELRLIIFADFSVGMHSSYENSWCLLTLI